MKLPPISIAPSDKPPVWSVILPISTAVAGVAAFAVGLCWAFL